MSDFEGIISASTSLILKDINVRDIRERYNNDEFDNIDISKFRTKKIKVKELFSKNRNNVPTEDIYVMHCKSNAGTVIVSDNCSSYKGKKRDVVIRCHYCRDDTKKAVGMPILIELGDDDTIIITPIGSYCNLSCCLAYALDQLKLPKTMTEYDWHQVITNIMFIHRLHSDEPLIPANDWRLLDINDGALDREEWENNSASYTILPSLIISPMKRLYQKNIINRT